MIERGDIRIEGKVMPHAHGAWAGMRPQTWTATHIKTGVSVSWSDLCLWSQHKARNTAIACLELLVEGLGADDLPVVVPPSDAPQQKQSAPRISPDPRTD